MIIMITPIVCQVRDWFAGDTSQVTENCKRRITTGQGEYIVFKNLEGTATEIDLKTHEKVYQLLVSHQPLYMKSADGVDAHKRCLNRYELLKKEVKTIDSTLEVAFIPRVLYELVFIRQLIQEDDTAGNICKFAKRFSHSAAPTDEDQRYRSQRKCWHLIEFGSQSDPLNKSVEELAFRLNSIMIQTFKPDASKEAFSYEELLSFTNSEIDFLMKLRDKQSSLKSMEGWEQGGPWTNFINEKVWGILVPMGVRHDKDAEIIRQVLSLECSEQAVKSCILYRGSNFYQDNILATIDGEDVPYSLSYGMGLFSGCVYDGGSVPFSFMRNETETAYAVFVDYDSLDNSPIYVPTSNTLCQLLSLGELFHPRTRAWENFSAQHIMGINFGPRGGSLNLLDSKIPKDELIARYNEIKSRAIIIRKPASSCTII